MISGRYGINFLGSERFLLYRQGTQYFGFLRFFVDKARAV